MSISKIDGISEFIIDAIDVVVAGEGDAVLLTADIVNATRQVARLAREVSPAPINEPHVSVRVLDANAVAIAMAADSGTLRIVESTNRFGDVFFAVDDDHGVIEVHFTEAEARRRAGDEAPLQTRATAPSSWSRRQS